jgi:hypothetical protein
MAPGLPDLESVRAVCAATTKPFNFMVGIKGKSFTVAALSAAGVKRISLATSLYRAAMTGLLSAAKEVREHGTFGYIDTSLATPRYERVPARLTYQPAALERNPGPRSVGSPEARVPTWSTRPHRNPESGITLRPCRSRRIEESWCEHDSECGAEGILEHDRGPALGRARRLCRAAGAGGQ